MGQKIEFPPQCSAHSVQSVQNGMDEKVGILLSISERRPGKAAICEAPIAQHFSRARVRKLAPSLMRPIQRQLRANDYRQQASNKVLAKVAELSSNGR